MAGYVHAPFDVAVFSETEEGWLHGNGKKIVSQKEGNKMGKYFGTDGFRGEANKDLTVDHAFRIGRYLGWYYGKDHKAKVVIGKDTRRSSYMFESALCAGLTASGADAYLLHVTSTPSVSYITRADDFDCGIMISARPSTTPPAGTATLAT